jgi:hypothetical protein
VFENLTRQPTTPTETTADVVRALGLLSFVVASLVVGGTAFPLFALILLGQFLSRFLGVPPALDITIGVVLLVAGWSNPLDLYRMIEHWDLVMHFSANGLIAVIAYLLFMRMAYVPLPSVPMSSARLSSVPTSSVRLPSVPLPSVPLLSATLPPVAGIVLITAFGLAAGVVWEIGEWFGHTFIDTSIVVEYTDTIGDLAAGGCGSLVAGCVVTLMSAHPRKRSTVVPLQKSLLSYKD